LRILDAHAVERRERTTPRTHSSEQALPLDRLPGTPLHRPNESSTRPADPAGSPLLRGVRSRSPSTRIRSTGPRPPIHRREQQRIVGWRSPLLRRSAKQSRSSSCADTPVRRSGGDDGGRVERWRLRRHRGGRRIPRFAGRVPFRNGSPAPPHLERAGQSELLHERSRRARWRSRNGCVLRTRIVSMRPYPQTPRSKHTKLINASHFTFATPKPSTDTSCEE